MKLLGLGHSDIYELNGLITTGSNLYFITFIDDFSKYAYAYLIKMKDETLNNLKFIKIEQKPNQKQELKYLDRIEEVNILQMNL